MELDSIEQWLASYDFGELFNSENGFDQDMLDILPEKELLIGDNPHVFAHKIYKDLILPDEKTLAKEVKYPGQLASQSMRIAGEYLREVFKLNDTQKNFRLMSPDETYSNRLDAIFEATSRAFVWTIEKDDKHLKWVSECIVRKPMINTETCCGKNTGLSNAEFFYRYIK